MITVENPYFEPELRDLRRRSALRYYLFVLSRLPLYVLWMAADALTDWSRSRRPEQLWWGLPAGFASLALLGVLVVAGMQRKDELLLAYKMHAARAMAAGELETAGIYYRKQLQLGIDDPRSLFEAAHVAGKIGRHAERQGLLSRLTDESFDFVPAHVLRAQELLAASPPQPANQQLAKNHLDKALTLDPLNPDANTVFGDLALQQGRIDQAIRHLELAANSLPSANYSLALAYRRQGEESAAISAAEKSLRFFAEQWGRQPKPAANLFWLKRMIQAQVFLGRFEDAIKSLASALAQRLQNQGIGRSRRQRLQPTLVQHLPVMARYLAQTQE